MVRFFILNFLQVGNGGSTPNALRRDFIASSNLYHKLHNIRRQEPKHWLPRKTCLSFYKQFACQMHGFRGLKYKCFIFIGIVPYPGTQANSGWR